jgi:hypothetical protein
MSDDFQENKELEVINEFMEQQQTKINQLQQQILLLTTKNTMLEKEQTKLKIINRQYKEQIEALTKVDRKSLSDSLDGFTSKRYNPIVEVEVKPKERKSANGSMFKNRGIINGISN